MHTQLVTSASLCAFLLCAAPNAARADLVDDFKRAAGSSECRAVPYSDWRGTCQRHYKRAKDRGRHLDCFKFKTRLLLTQIEIGEKEIRALKRKKNPDKRKIADLKRAIAKKKREVERRKRRAKKRYDRAKRVIKNLTKAGGYVGRRLSRRMKKDVEKARKKAERAKKDKSRHAKLKRRADKLSSLSSRINRRTSSFFQDQLMPRNRKAKKHMSFCYGAYKGTE